MRLWGLTNCDTTRLALKELRAIGLAPEVSDVREAGISQALAAEMLVHLGDKLVNRASTTWRSLSEDERARPLEALLTDHPLLMKRPVIARDGVWTMGWSAETRANYLAGGS